LALLSLVSPSACCALDQAVTQSPAALRAGIAPARRAMAARKAENVADRMVGPPRLQSLVWRLRRQKSSWSRGGPVLWSRAGMTAWYVSMIADPYRGTSNSSASSSAKQD